MTGASVPGLVTSLAIPTIFTMLISAFYNMADTFFVARLGTGAAAAVGIVFSVMSFIQAVAFMVGIGCGSTVSRALGAQDNTKADRIGSSAFLMALCFGALLALTGLVFPVPLMRMLGSTDTILPYSVSYAGYIFWGAPVLCCSIVLNNILRAEGKAILATIGLGFGGLLNVALDPLFIFKFNMGISGAAAATLLSQCVSFGILFAFFRTGKTITRLSPRFVSTSVRDYLRILGLGSSSFCRQGLAGISTVALNVGAGGYGDAAVAAMSIVGRIFFFVLAALIGFGQGFQPVAGYNYGAEKFDRVRAAFNFTVRTGTIFLTAIAVIGFIFAPQVVGLFRVGDPAVLAIGAAALRAQCLALPLQPLIVLSNMLFQSIGKASQAVFISSTRQGIYFIPLILLLPTKFGLNGLLATQPLSDLLAFLSCLPFLWCFFRSLRLTEAPGCERNNVSVPKSVSD